MAIIESTKEATPDGIVTTVKYTEESPWYFAGIRYVKSMSFIAIAAGLVYLGTHLGTYLDNWNIPQIYQGLSIAMIVPLLAGFEKYFSAKKELDTPVDIPPDVPTTPAQ